MAEVLVDRGYPVLLYDKPGVNASTGDWRRQSFQDRADEVIAAVHHLAQRDDIDAGRIGLVGMGWPGLDHAVAILPSARRESTRIEYA